MRPMIGCVASYDDERIDFEKPAEAIHFWGANLIFLAHTNDPARIQDYLDLVDGLLLGSGGEDISPTWLHEPPHPKLGVVDLVRDECEIALLHGAFQRQMPVLGICRGAQIINVAAGGTIYQDVRSQRVGTFLDHFGDWEAYRRQERGPNTHRVRIAPKTTLHALLPAGEYLVNSYHHQAVKVLATGFRIAAVAEDGVVEAIESTMHPFVLGLQWHPDLIWELADQRNIFEMFVTHATHAGRGNRQNRKIFY